MKYKKNFLKKVVFRIDFIKEMNEIDDEIIDPSKLEKITKNFPIFEPTNNIGTNITVNFQKSDVNKEEIKEKHYIFYKLDRKSKLIIRNKSIVYETNNYINFNDLKENIEFITNIFSFSEKSIVGRIGLRYINLFQNESINTIDWNKYINPELLTSINKDYGGGKISQGITSLDIKYDEYYLKKQYGIYNQFFPNDNLKDAFIIDLDIYKFEIESLNRVIQILEDWNFKLESIFEDSITGEMREVLNGTRNEL
ncbi:MAG: hypothetical protein K0R72_943 [Clostridia bacterium]|jgi:uncharacterized protein (TIGR04255 family)|nr:hypothetical protein [Clostridia bacterium]